MRGEDGALGEAIDTLYGVFMRYALAPRVGGCPCCTDERDEQLLRSAPLHRMSAGALSRYAFKAMTTWGGVDDFRHFLPRLFELAALDPNGFSYGIELLFGKLRHAGWEDWPAREQDAVARYLRAFWNAALSGEAEAYETEERLCCLGCASDSIEPLLEAWIEPPHASKLRLLAGWLLSGEALGSAFWHPEARSRARAWLLDARTSERLEEIFFAGDEATQAVASGALDGIARMRFYSRGA